MNQNLPSSNPEDPSVTVPESAVLNLLQCPVCLDPSLTPPIFQCVEGHLICSQCQPKVNAKCPICRGRLGNARSYLAEQLVSLVFSPCRYSNKGCTAHFLKNQENELAEHELDCDHQEFQCPCPLTGGSCVWNGDLKAVHPHLLNFHMTAPFQLPKYPGNQMIQVRSDQNPCKFVTLSGTSKTPTVVLQSTIKYHFLHMVTQTEKELYFATQLVGTKKQAEGFRVRLSLKAGDKRWTREGAVKSVLGGLPQTQDCLRIEPQHLDLESTLGSFQTGYLNFNVRVINDSAPSSASQALVVFSGFDTVD